MEGSRGLAPESYDPGVTDRRSTPNASFGMGYPYIFCLTFLGDYET